jgi:hypothetical protein
MYDDIGMCGSREYRVGYELNSSSDIPEGFSIPFQAGTWRKAILVPGDRHNGWRTTQHSPRIYILKQNELTIYSHPECGEQPFAIPLDELITVTSHKARSLGTVEFSTLSSSGSFHYDPLHQRYIKSLLSALRLQWLPLRAVSAVAIDLKDLDPPLELRSRYALELELDTGEFVLSICSQPLAYSRTRTCFIPGRRPSFTSCLVLTNRRIMTIASRNGHANDHSEVTIRYAALSNTAGAEIERHDDGFSLSLTLRDDCVWNLCLAASQAASASKMIRLLRHG